MNSRKKILIYEIMLYIIFIYIYKYIIFKRFQYMGFEWEINFYNFMFGFILLIISLFFINLIKNDYWYSISSIIFTFYLLGSVIYYQFNNANIKVVLSIVLLIIFMYVFSHLKINFCKKTYNLNNRKDIRKILLIISIILVIPFLIFYGKYINIKNLFFIDVYDTRMLFREIKVPILGYLISPLSRVLLPILTIAFIEKKQKYSAIICIILMVIIYLCGATKSIFIGILAILFFYKGDYVIKVERFLKTLLAVSIVGIILFILLDNVFLIDTFIRRLFFLPSKLENVYYGHFFDNFTYGMHTEFGKMLSSSHYFGDLGLYIGEIVMHKSGMNANVGVLTEGYVSFGMIGVIIAILIISGIYLIIQSLNIDKKYFGILFVYIYYIKTSFLFTLLITHGLMFLIIFLYLFLKDSNE